MKNILKNHGVNFGSGNFAVQHPGWNAVNVGRPFMKLASGGMPLHESMNSLSTSLVTIYRRVQTITEANRTNPDIRRNGEQIMADLAAKIGSVQAMAHTRGVDPRLSGARSTPIDVRRAASDLSTFLIDPVSTPLTEEQELQLIKARVAAAFGTTLSPTRVKQTASRAPDDVVTRIDTLIGEIGNIQRGMTDPTAAPVSDSLNLLINTLQGKRDERGFVVEGDYVAVLNLISSNLRRLVGSGSANPADINLINAQIRAVGNIKISQPEREVDAAASVTVATPAYTIKDFGVISTSWPKARGLAALGSAVGIGFPLAKWVVIPLVSLVISLFTPSAPAPREVHPSDNGRPAVVQPVQQTTWDKWVIGVKDSSYYKQGKITDSDLQSVKQEVGDNPTEAQLRAAWGNLKKKKEL